MGKPLRCRLGWRKWVTQYSSDGTSRFLQCVRCPKQARVRAATVVDRWLAEDDGPVAVQQHPGLGVPRTARESTEASTSRPAATSCSGVWVWSTRVTSCSMIGPSSRSPVT